MDNSISIADAKAKLSAVVRDVGDTGSEYVITVRGVPVARIIPVPKQPRVLRGFGALTTNKPPLSSEEIEAEWRRAAEERYATAARH